MVVLTVCSKSTSLLSQKEKMISSNIKVDVCKCCCYIIKCFLLGLFVFLKRVCCYISYFFHFVSEPKWLYDLCQQKIEQKMDVKVKNTFFSPTVILLSRLWNAPEQRLIGTEQSISKVIHFVFFHTLMSVCEDLLVPTFWIPVCSWELFRRVVEW